LSLYLECLPLDLSLDPDRHLSGYIDRSSSVK
jgi:hypothetical protein